MMAAGRSFRRYRLGLVLALLVVPASPSEAYFCHAGKGFLEYDLEVATATFDVDPADCPQESHTWGRVHISFSFDRWPWGAEGPTETRYEAKVCDPGVRCAITFSIEHPPDEGATYNYVTRFDIEVDGFHYGWTDGGEPCQSRIVKAWCGPIQHDRDRYTWPGEEDPECGFIPTTCPATHRPLNNDFVLATPLLGDTGTLQGSTRWATAEPGEPSHGGISSGHSVWYRLMPERSGVATIDTCSSNQIDPVTAVYVGSSMSDLREVAFNDDWWAVREERPPGCKALESIVEFAVGSGETYWIVVDTFESRAWGGLEQGPLTISWAIR